MQKHQGTSLLALVPDSQSARGASKRESAGWDGWVPGGTSE